MPADSINRDKVIMNCREIEQEGGRVGKPYCDYRNSRLQTLKLFSGTISLEWRLATEDSELTLVS
jgi:hypothetical protein